MSAKNRIEEVIKNNKVVLFMKGTPDMPQCGFSAATSDVLKNMGVNFQGVDVLQDMEVREEVKTFSNWPTIPQLYINGEFVGGCDIVREMYQTGDLKKKLEAASAV